MGGPTGNLVVEQDSVYPQITSMQGWTQVAVADLDHDGNPDIIWQNDVNGQLAEWYMADAAVITFRQFGWIYAGTDLGSWKVVGVADLDRDGHPDIVLQQQDQTSQNLRRVGVWYMGGTTGNSI